MSDGHSLMEKQQQQLPVTNDGWNDAAKEAAERPINGTLLKFADWRWTAGKEATAVPDGTRLIAMATIALWTRWEDGKPVEYRIREAGHRLPERDELGYDDQSEWEIGPGGEPQDLWRNTSISSIREPPKPSPSRRQVGAAAARSLTWVIRSRVCATCTQTRCRSSNYARRKCPPSTDASQSRCSRSSAGRPPMAKRGSSSAKSHRERRSGSSMRAR